MCIVNSLGSGREATLEALRTGRGGLKPCTFETVTLETHVGEVPGVDDAGLPADLAPYDTKFRKF